MAEDSGFGGLSLRSESALPDGRGVMHFSSVGGSFSLLTISQKVDGVVDEVLTDEFLAKLSDKAKEGAIRAISTMMVLAQS